MKVKQSRRPESSLEQRGRHFKCIVVYTSATSAVSWLSGLEDVSRRDCARFQETLTLGRFARSWGSTGMHSFCLGMYVLDRAFDVPFTTLDTEKRQAWTALRVCTVPPADGFCRWLSTSCECRGEARESELQCFEQQPVTT